jgi:hypothetical protein
LTSEHRESYHSPRPDEYPPGFLGENMKTTILTLGLALMGLSANAAQPVTLTYATDAVLHLCADADRDCAERITLGKQTYYLSTTAGAWAQLETIKGAYAHYQQKQTFLGKVIGFTAKEQIRTGEVVNTFKAMDLQIPFPKGR